MKRKNLDLSEELGYTPPSRSDRTVGNKQTLNGRLHQIVDELVHQGVTLEQARQEFERQFIMASLRSNDWNFCRSARHLGVHRNTLRNKVSHLGIGVTEGRITRTGVRPMVRRPAPKA